MSVAQILADRAAEQPERPALFFRGTVVTYAELDRRVAPAAAALSASGCRFVEQNVIKAP